MDPRASLTFVGTATTVLRLGAFTLLTEPNFIRRGERVHLGYGLTSKRRTDPALGVAELPPLDAVLLSHLHGDHFDRLLPPVMGSVLDLERGGERVLRAYVTGDTLRVPELREIRTRFPDIDVMITHLGGTRVLGVLVTMDGSQGADLVEMIEPAAVVPVHHDDYGVFRSPLEDFVAELRRRGQDGRLRPVTRGDTVTLAPQRH